MHLILRGSGVNRPASAFGTVIFMLIAAFRARIILRSRLPHFRAPKFPLSMSKTAFSVHSLREHNCSLTARTFPCILAKRDGITYFENALCHVHLFIWHGPGLICKFVPLIDNIWFLPVLEWCWIRDDFKCTQSWFQWVQRLQRSGRADKRPRDPLKPHRYLKMQLGNHVRAPINHDPASGRHYSRPARQKMCNRNS